MLIYKLIKPILTKMSYVYHRSMDLLASGYLSSEEYNAVIKFIISIEKATNIFVEDIARINSYDYYTRMKMFFWKNNAD